MAVFDARIPPGHRQRPATKWKELLMVIKTKSFSFTKAIYFTILLKNSLKSNWWVLVLLAGLAGYQSTKGWSPALAWCGGGLVAFVLYLVFRCWRHTAAKHNPLFYADRHFEIDSQFLNCRFADGTLNQIKLASMKRIVRTAQHYELYLSRKQFIYLPVTAFASQRDLNLFQTLLKGVKWG